MKKNNCKLILFNEKHLGCLLFMVSSEVKTLPTTLIKEDENLFDALKRLEDEIGVVASNELLNYVVESDTGVDYIFIGQSEVEPTSDGYEWIIGKDITNVDNLEMCDSLKENLSERFNNAFIMDRTFLIKDV